MAKKYEKIDTLYYEGSLDEQLKLMKQAMDILKQTITEGVKLQDKLVVSQPKTVSLEEVKSIVSELHTAVRNVEYIHGLTRELIDSVHFAVQEEKSKAQNMDSKYFAELKKLDRKATKAKSELVGYSINTTKKDAYKTVESITKTVSAHSKVITR